MRRGCHLQFVFVGASYSYGAQTCTAHSICVFHAEEMRVHHLSVVAACCCSRLRMPATPAARAEKYCSWGRLLEALISSSSRLVSGCALGPSQMLGPASCSMSQFTASPVPARVVSKLSKHRRLSCSPARLPEPLLPPSSRLVQGVRAGPVTDAYACIMLHEPVIAIPMPVKVRYPEGLS